MSWEIDIDELKELVGQVNFQAHGDKYEQKYGHLFANNFPRLELFWRNFVTPMTRRFDRTPSPVNVQFRLGVSRDLMKIAELHYSVFMHLVYAHQSQISNIESSFENFYSHLVTACDLAEDFLLCCYLLYCECSGQESPLHRKRSKKDVLQHFERWYDEKYDKLYREYYSKGKVGPPIWLPSREDILENYFNGSKREWDNYRNHRDALGRYRNKCIHQPLIGKAIDKEKQVFILSPEFVNNKDYELWVDVFKAMSDPYIRKSRFVEMNSQMSKDFEMTLKCLNALWRQPLDDFTTLFYEDKNIYLLQHYGIMQVSNQQDQDLKFATTLMFPITTDSPGTSAIGTPSLIASHSASLGFVYRYHTTPASGYSQDV